MRAAGCGFARLAQLATNQSPLLLYDWVGDWIIITKLRPQGPMSFLTREGRVGRVKRWIQGVRGEAGGAKHLREGRVQRLFRIHVLAHRSL